MKLRYWASYSALAWSFAFCMQAFGQTSAVGHPANCPSTAVLPDLLQIEDQVSQFGPRLEDAQLVLLQNGRRAVIFSVRNVPINGTFQYWNIRYRITWQDACGRLLPDISRSVEGFVLNPSDVQTFQSVAFDPHAVRAVLRIYIE